MGKIRDSQAAEHLFLILTFCAAMFLFLCNLGNQYLWEDEAETALISKTVLQYGIPKGYDGKNFFSQEGWISYGKDYIWALDPWLSYYLVAVFFKMFGVSTFTARLPFSLFGVATVILTYFFARSLTGDKKIAGVAASLLVLSVPFLILSRQCRYYSLVAFFSLLGLYGYITLLKGRKSGSILFAVSAILLFHCNHLFCATLLATVFIHAVFFHREKLAKVLVSSLTVVLLNLPWLIWFPRAGYVNLYGYRIFDKEFFVFLYSYLQMIHYFIFPFFLLLVPVVKLIFLWTRHKSIKAVIAEDTLLWKNLLLLLLFIAVTIVSVSIISPDWFFRYIAQLIPVCCIITAIILTSAVRPYFKTGIATIAVLLGVFYIADYRYNIIKSNEKGMKYPNFCDYLYEITHDYDGPIEGIVKYLNEYGSKDDVVAITNGDMPLKFYTSMKVIGGLSGEDLSPAKQAKWVILRRHTLCEKDVRVRLYLEQNVPWENYEGIVIDYPDIPWENREDPAEHQFRTVVNEIRVVIFRRVK